jgi:L-ascorbate 6-phosphate lactonase
MIPDVLSIWYVLAFNFQAPTQYEAEFYMISQKDNTGMIHSTWDDWFISQEVEESDPDQLTVWYLGCNGFILRSPKTTVYIDPYFADGNPPNIVRMIPVPMDPADASLCDAVLITHEHIDHMHPPSYGPLLQDGDATIYAPEASYDNPDYDESLHATPDQRSTIGEGDKFDVGDLTIHVRGANDPDAIEPVTFVVEHESGTFVHIGDSRPADNFANLGEEFDIDLGAIAFGSVGMIYEPSENRAEVTRWYNDENQVIEAARALQLRRLLPTHWDMWRGVGADPTALYEHAASYEYPKLIESAKIGDRLNITEPGTIQLETLRQ